MRDQICPKCGSRDIIPNVAVIDRGHGDGYHDLHVEIVERPQALIFSGAHAASELRAWICGACGFSELYAARPRELLEIYRRSRGRSSEREP